MEETDLLMIQYFTPDGLGDLTILYGKQTTVDTNTINIYPEEDLKYIGAPIFEMIPMIKDGLVHKMKKPFNKVNKLAKFFNIIVLKEDG